MEAEKLKREGRKVIAWQEGKWDLSIWKLDGLRFYLCKFNTIIAIEDVWRVTFDGAADYYKAHKDSDAYYVDRTAGFRLNYQSPMYL